MKTKTQNFLYEYAYKLALLAMVGNAVAWILSPKLTMLYVAMFKSLVNASPYVAGAYLTYMAMRWLYVEIVCHKSGFYKKELQ
jgi:hypothetical protein